MNPRAEGEWETKLSMFAAAALIALLLGSVVVALAIGALALAVISRNDEPAEDGDGDPGEPLEPASVWPVTEPWSDRWWKWRIVEPDDEFLRH